MQQQDLPLGHLDADTIALRLSSLLGVPAKVVLTENRRSIISVKRHRNELAIRMHRCFAAANDQVLNAVALLARRKNPEATRVLSAFFHDHAETSATPRPTTRSLVAQGRHFDLQAIFEDLNQRYFEGAIQAQITWGRGRPRFGFRARKSRHIVLGTYLSRERIIVIHPHLDRPLIPRYVVEAVVFHEMCHQHVPDVVVKGRRRMHTRIFREQEQRFPLLTEAREWERAHIDYLLRRERRTSNATQ